MSQPIPLAASHSTSPRLPFFPIHHVQNPETGGSAKRIGESSVNDAKLRSLAQLVFQSKNEPSFEGLSGGKRIKRSDPSDTENIDQIEQKRQVLRDLRSEIENSSLRDETKTIFDLILDVLNHLVDVEDKSHWNYGVGIPEVPPATWQSVGRKIRNLSTVILGATRAGSHSSAQEDIFNELRLVVSKLAQQMKVFHDALRNNSTAADDERPPQISDETRREIHHGVNRQIRELGHAMNSLFARTRESGEFSNTEKTLFTRLLDEVKKIREFVENRTDYTLSSR